MAIASIRQTVESSTAIDERSPFGWRRAFGFAPYALGGAMLGAAIIATHHVAMGGLRISTSAQLDNLAEAGPAATDVVAPSTLAIATANRRQQLVDRADRLKILLSTNATPSDQSRVFGAMLLRQARESAMLAHSEDEFLRVETALDEISLKYASTQIDSESGNANRPAVEATVDLPSEL